MDGNAAAASAPARRRVPRRAPRWLHTCSVNTMGRSGTIQSSEGKETPDKLAGGKAPRGRPPIVPAAASQRIQSRSPLRLRSRLQQPQQLGRERGKFRARHRTPRVNDDVPSRRYLRKIPAKDLADAPFDAVAHYRSAQCLLDADSQSAVPQSVGPQQRAKLPPPTPPP